MDEDSTRRPPAGRTTPATGSSSCASAPTCSGPDSTYDRVREAAQKGTLELALVGSDASENSLDKVVPLLRAKGVRIVQGISAAALGGAAGKEATAVIGIVDANLAKGIRGVVDAVGA